MFTTDTIAAISTADGNGAVGIVRLSGSESIRFLEKIWKGSTPVGRFSPRRVYNGWIATPSGETIDQVLCFIFKNPSSYTGEDMVEIQGHGGRSVLQRILQTVLEAGARMARPGEFTQRAFLNGRMDLAQAEAVADLIGASGERAVREAERHLEGRLSECVRTLRNEILVLRAQMEAMIDFPEDEDVQSLHYDEAGQRVARIMTQVRRLTETYEEGRLLREGLRIAIIGKPNVGKSSLFNALLREDRAIVHATPGTTRDLVEEIIHLDGLAVRFIDTAGLRETAEPVEAEGIRRTRERMGQADLILVILDGSEPLDSQDEEILASAQAPAKSSIVWCIMNKSDLHQKWDRESILKVSAKTGAGLESLRHRIMDRFLKKESAEPILTNLRHRDALRRGLDCLGEAYSGCVERRPLDLLAEDLIQASNALGAVTGEIINDEILGEIFARFCIGK